MDPNQNQPQTPTPPPTVPPVQNPMGGPTTPAPPPQVPPSGAPQPVSLPDQGTGQSAPKSNGKIILFIIIGTFLLVVLGLIYFMAQQFNSSRQNIAPTPTQILTPTPSPTPTPLSEEDIDTINLGSPEADLKVIEDDIKQL